MDHTPGENQTRVLTARLDHEKSNDGVDKGFIASRRFSSDAPPSEVPAVHNDTRTPSDQDSEKTVTELANKYAKYAGEPPDGGFKAWSVILATFLTTCATFGYVNAWGIFQQYYEAVMLRDSSPSDIAWIGSTQYALILLPGLVTGRLFDMGYFKIPFIFASCLLIVCNFLIAECTVYWQFLLAQGLGAGIACGVLFGPALGVISHWFSKRRGLALGINAIGSSVGGTVFPIAAQKLIPEVGFKWTMRIFGFILILLLGVASLMIDRRLPPVNMEGGLFNWAALKNRAYATYCAASVTTFLGLYVVLTYMPISSVQVGIPYGFSLYFISIANGSSAFGRILAGFLADRFGALNVMIPSVVIVAITTFIWPFVTGKGALIAIAVIYGFSCGTYVSLYAAPAIAMGAIGDVGRRTGLLLSFSAFGALCGPPISGAINSATGGFEDVGWYAGGTLLLAVCLLLLTRHLHLGGKLIGKF